jgi:hypothetical protein
LDELTDSLPNVKLSLGRVYVLESIVLAEKLLVAILPSEAILMFVGSYFKLLEHLFE